ncbi:MAG TPA: hypothetical protein VK577_14370, partial [Bradyrhizobium sp.]|nr:hypothetical protein [Bradyrhizobium sp.]
EIGRPSRRIHRLTKLSNVVAYGRRPSHAKDRQFVQPSRRFIGIGARLVEGNDGSRASATAEESRKGEWVAETSQTSKTSKTSETPKRVPQYDNHPTGREKTRW